MVALTASQRLNLPLAPVAAMIVGGAAAAAVAVFPIWRIEGLVLDLGIAALFPPAEPPLGMTARILMVLVAWCIAAGATYLAATRFLNESHGRSVNYSRAPVMATRDLGKPFLEVTATDAPVVEHDVFAAPVEQDMPKDLDVPLAAFDPAAIPPVPVAPSATVTPLHRVRPAEDDARIETFELTPPNRPRAAPPHRDMADEAIAAPETDATIHILLQRLERGVARRRTTPAMTERPDAAGFDDAMATLGRLAARG